MISPFPKGLVLNKALDLLGLFCSLSADLPYLLPTPYSYPLTYLISCTYPYVQAGVLFSLPNVPTLCLSIYRGSPLFLKPYFKYHQISRFSMVYKYVFVIGVNSDLYILITYERVMFFTRWGFWTSPYTWSLPCLHRVMRWKNPLLSQIQITSWSRVPLG